MKRVLCILEEGFEEIEAITPVDFLRRAGVEVVMVGISTVVVTGKTGVRVVADALLDEVSCDDFCALLLPGGSAVMKLRNNDEVIRLIQSFHRRNCLIAAICAAPLLLKDAGVILGRRFTSHFTTQGELPESTNENVEMDGGLLTSRGAGTSIEFGLAFVELLVGPRAKEEVAIAVMAS